MKREKSFSTKVYVKSSILIFSLLINSNCSSSLDLNLESKDADSFISIEGLKAFNISHNNKSSIKRNLKQNLKKSSELIIEDIRLTDTGKSIHSENKEAQDSIKPDYKEKFIYITLKGKFKSKNDIKLNKMLFTNEDNLVNQTFIENEPKTRVLINNSILLEPISVNEEKINLRINTQGIPDFYLKGIHKITLHAGNYYTDTLISVGEPEHVNNLNPTIEKVEIIYDKNKPINLKITGQNYMLYPKFSYAKIDGVFGFGHETTIFKENDILKWETIIHIPEPDKFRNKTIHTINYLTPFGMAYKEF